MVPTVADDVALLDDVLGRLARTGPEYSGGLSNHGPMAAEALVRLGRSDAVRPWAESYAAHLHDAPQAGRPLGPGDRSTALGRPRRYADWLATFEVELCESPWQEVLADTLPVLLPGAIAAATHGLIRTGHAARALEEADTPARRGELARALAYWASVFVVLPGSPALHGTLGPRAASRALPLLPEGLRTGGFITEEALGVSRLAAWDDAVGSVRPPVDVDAAFSELTSTNASWYLAEAEARPIAFVHGVTAPAAARLLLPYVPVGLHQTVFAYAWQACAALRVAIGTAVAPAGSLGEAHANVSPEELADRAVASGDAHAIKLTEACVREARRADAAVFVAAALDATARLSG